MKKHVRIFLWGFAVLVLFSSRAAAQCPGCTPNTVLCQGSNGPCPASFDTAYAYNSYSDTLTFNLPPTVDASQQSGGILGIVPFVEFKIANIQGLPFGINYTCDQPNCTYAPFANNGTFACVRFCGAPLAAAGTYNITINTVGTIDGGTLGLQSGAQPFYLTLVVMPDTSSGNSGFSFSSNSFCVPSVVNFTNGVPSNGYVPGPLNSGFSYSWNFGNGIQSTSENPPPITYYQSGSYPVSYTAIIDTFPITLKEVNLTATNCTDFLNPADRYIKIFDASNNEVFNNETAQSTTLPFVIPVGIPILNPPYRIEVWDDDTAPIGGTADDNCYDNTETTPPTITLQLPPAGTFGLTTYNFSSQATTLAFTYTYEKVTINVTAEDTIEIFDLPPATALGVAPSTAVCNRDSIMLSVYPGFYYDWYRDTTLMASGTSEVFYAKLPGDYYVVITDLNSGCSTISSDTALTFYPNLPPGYPNVGIAINQNGDLQSALSGNGILYQWLFFDGSQFIPIPGETSGIYTPLLNGAYALIATNEFGCTDTSNTIQYFGVGLNPENSEQLSVSVYPNPVLDFFHVRVENATKEDIQVVITDLLGHRLQEVAFSVTGNVFDTQVPVTGIAPGIYLVEVHTTQGIFTQRILKK